MEDATAPKLEIAKTMEFHEVETKYSVEGELVYAFKKLVQEFEDLKDFIYVESDDIYYMKGEEFLRYRFSNSKKDERAELTYKSKTVKGNNMVRKEINLRVDSNALATVEEFANCLNFQRNFRISKIVHIYHFGDATIPFYTVIDENGKMRHFIEIEVKEENLSSLSEAQCWDIITKYEKLLAPLGITAQKRLRKSLFEIYRRPDGTTK